MKLNRLTIFVAIVVAAFAFTAVAPSDSYGQTKRKKKTTAKRKPIPAPVLPQGDAEIVSQAGSEIIQNGSLDTPQVLPSSSGAIDLPDANAERIKDLRSRVKKLESNKPNEYDEQQKRLLLNLDILTRAEQRSESIRKQVFELVEKETAIRTKLDQLEFDARPEIIERSSVTFAGSLRPEQIREMREKSLKAEQKNLQALYDQIEVTKASLEANLLKSDALVEKLRTKLEKDIDDSLKAADEDN